MLQHQKNLRIGRFSQANQIYHITFTTKNRAPIFNNFANAHLVTRMLKQSDALQHTSTLAFVVMPDHIHWLFALGSKQQLQHVIKTIKSKVTIKMGQPIWQAGFYDHAIRKHEDVIAIARYIIANPIRAGLVARVGDYPHWHVAWL